MSAREWIASASIDAAPVSTNTTNLLSAIPRFARNAATIARRGPMIHSISSRSSDDPAARHRLDVERAVELGVGHQLAGPARCSRIDVPVRADSFTISAAAS